MSRGSSLGERFARDKNALTLVRLLLALSVVLYHAHRVPSEDKLEFYGGQFLSTFHVDAFFGLSGFLIYAAWERCPEARRYLRHRAARARALPAGTRLDAQAAGVDGCLRARSR